MPPCPKYNKLLLPNRQIIQTSFANVTGVQLIGKSQKASPKISRMQLATRPHPFGPFGYRTCNTIWGEERKRVERGHSEKEREMEGGK